MCKQENGHNGNGNGHRLTGKQRAFVDAWFSNGFNGTEAARAAEYGNGDATDNALAASASRTLRNVKVLAEIENRFSGHGVTAEEVLSVLAGQMRASPGDFMDEFGRVDLLKVKENGRSLIKAVEIDKGNKIKLTLESSQTAAEKIGRALGMFKEKVEHSGPDGGPIVVDHEPNADTIAEALRILGIQGAVPEGGV